MTGREAGSQFSTANIIARAGIASVVASERSITPPSVLRSSDVDLSVAATQPPAQPPQALPGHRPNERMPRGLASSGDNIWESHMFRVGLIVSAPCHGTAQNPYANPTTDDRVVQTKCAVVNSKRRMLLILYAYDDMAAFVLPIGSQRGEGLKHILSELKKYYITLKDFDDDDFHNESRSHKPLVVTRMFGGEPMGKVSSVCLTAGFTIKFNEDIRKVGYISRASADYVTKQHAALSGRALDSTWIKNNRS